MYRQYCSSKSGYHCILVHYTHNKDGNANNNSKQVHLLSIEFLDNNTASYMYKYSVIWIDVPLLYMHSVGVELSADPITEQDYTEQLEHITTHINHNIPTCTTTICRCLATTIS